jgi:alanyl-tRNA synthetase
MNMFGGSLRKELAWAKLAKQNTEARERREQEQKLREQEQKLRELEGRTDPAAERAYAEAYPDRVANYVRGATADIHKARIAPGKNNLAIVDVQEAPFYAKSGGLWEKNADGQGEYVATGRTHADCERLAAILNSAIAMALGIAARYQK